MEGLLHGVASWLISVWPWLLGIASFYISGAWVAAYWTGRKRISPGKKPDQYQRGEEAEWGFIVGFWPVIVLWYVGIWLLMIPVAPFVGLYRFIIWGHTLGESRAGEVKGVERAKPVEGEVIDKPRHTSASNPYTPGSAAWKNYQRTH